VTLPIRAVLADESGDDLPEVDEDNHLAMHSLPLTRLDGLRVMVVDDEFDARRLIVKVLQQAGAIVTAAASAAEAIEALAAADPEVLVSDLGMPDEDGFDLIREIRKRGYHAKDLPAIALTAFVRKTERHQALLAGFQLHVAKPVEPHELTEFIASLAGRTVPTDRPIIAGRPQL
jgi:CheY-like chemotaxis protein